MQCPRTQRSTGGQNHSMSVYQHNNFQKNLSDTQFTYYQCININHLYHLYQILSSLVLAIHKIIYKSILVHVFQIPYLTADQVL